MFMYCLMVVGAFLRGRGMEPGRTWNPVGDRGSMARDELKAYGLYGADQRDYEELIGNTGVGRLCVLFREEVVRI